MAVFKSVYNHLMAKSYTRSGDDGTTGLIGDRRVPKYDLRPTAYGTVDEASSALGLAKSLSGSTRIRGIIHEAQRHLYLLMAELAAAPENAAQFRSIDATHVEWLESRIASFEADFEMPHDFVIPGNAPASASMDFARTVVRRAERDVALLLAQEPDSNPYILPYLNRLSSLCFTLSLWTLHTEEGEEPDLAKRDRS
jgi:cob(I)alamin adenosyltransferase